jgi:hypothetical protein
MGGRPTLWYASQRKVGKKQQHDRERTFAFWQHPVPPYRRGVGSDGSLEIAARARERHKALQRSGGGNGGPRVGAGCGRTLTVTGVERVLV